MGGITAASGGRAVEAGDLKSLQARMKNDPPGYEQELLLQLRHFDACVSIMLLQSSSSAASSSSLASTFGDAAAAKEVANCAMFLAHMAPFYPQYLKQLPWTLLRVLDAHQNLEANLRRTLTRAVILLRNRKLVGLEDLLPIMMDLQCGGDRVVRKLAFLHIVHDIRRINLKHKNEPSNRKLQTVLFSMLQGDDETKAKRALIILAELHRRKVWADDRTANAICYACLHKSPRIMIAALRFLLGYDQQKDEDEDGDSESDKEEIGVKGSVAVQREVIYKAYHKGTVASKKKKQHKLQRAIRSMQKQQRVQAQETQQGSHAPLQHVVDPQTFTEKLFARLRISNEKFEVKLMMMQLISRAIGINRLMLLNFYPFLQKYIEPQQRDVTLVLAAAVQACHDLVPPDAVESMVRQLVNHFVHDRARPEVIAVGLNTVREICMRIPLIMTSELLTDLALYKKSREKAVAAAARSIISVYRQLWPSLLEKKDRGRNADLSARPKAFGATTVHAGVDGLELLLEDDNDDDEDDEDLDDDEGEGHDDAEAADDGDDDLGVQSEGTDDGLSEPGESGEDDEMVPSDLETDEDDSPLDDEGDGSLDDEGDDEVADVLIEDDMRDSGVPAENPSKKQEAALEDVPSAGGVDHPGDSLERASKRRRVSDQGVDDNVGIEQQSLRSLKRVSSEKKQLQAPTAITAGTEITSKDGDGILSNEDFEHIRSLQAKRAAKHALAASGLKKSGKGKEAAVKISTSEALSRRRIDPSVLEANIRKRREKEERIAMAHAGRENREAYGSRTASKQRKTGGTSNREKEKRKAMPLGAVRSKVARNKGRKSKMKGKNQFRGKKAWK